MGKKLTGKERIRKVLTSLRRIASELVRDRKDKAWGPETEKEMFKGVSASRGEESIER